MQKNLNNPLPELPTIKVVLYPELIAASLRSGEIDLYVLWSILKATDNYCAGSGKISMASLLHVIQRIFRLMPSQAYKKVNQGIGKYWNKFGKSSGGEKVTTLVGRWALVERLKPTSTRSEPFVFEVRDLERGEEAKPHEMKYLMIAAIASRYVDGRPISIRSICELTNQSERTVQRALGDCVDLNVRKSCQPISSHKTILEARANLLRIAKDDNLLAYSIEQNLDSFVIYRRRPNIYSLTKPARLPLRKRPKELRAKDVENMANLSKKRYYHEESKKPIEHEHLKFSGIEFLPSGVTAIWDEKNATAQQIQCRRSLVGRWEDIKREQTMQKQIRANDNRNTSNVSI